VLTNMLRAARPSIRRPSPFCTVPPAWCDAEGTDMASGFYGGGDRAPADTSLPDKPTGPDQ